MVAFGSFGMARRGAALAVALSLAATPTPSDAIAPVLLLMVKQIAKSLAESMIKEALLSGLAGMGCKGIALANALEALSLRRGIGGIGGVSGLVGAMGGVPRLSAGMSGLSALSGGAGLPNIPQMPNMPNLQGLNGIANLQGMPGMPNLPGMPALPMAPAGLGGAAVPPELMAKMNALMPGAGQIPEGAGLEPDQVAMMGNMLQGLGRPLSPPETVAAIDELAELGFLPPAIQSELKQCMVVLPSSIPALGMGMSMLQPMVPQLRQARDEMLALSPAEQDEIAEALANEIAPLPAAQRAEFAEYLGAGFFPPRVSAGVKARLATR